MNCSEAIYLMHDYFDDDIDEYLMHELFEHSNNCITCKAHFNELKMTNQLLKQLPKERLSSDITFKILESIPGKKKVRNWATKYPVVAAASIFLFLFSISLVSYVVPSNEFKIVSGNEQNLIVNGNEVIIPKGQEVLGDIIIENGNLQIDGEVKGNVTVFNGEIFMANASQVNGRTYQIDQIFERIWYQIKYIWKK